MNPATHDIIIKRGDTKEIFFRVRTRVYNETTQAYEAGPYRDLTGWTPKAQIRASEDAAQIIAEFTVTLSDQVAVTGGVLLRLAPAVTELLTDTEGVWDCQLTSPAGDVYTYIKGTYALAKDVTK